MSNHLSKYKFDKFHVISRNLGWENFSLSVIEINNYSKLIERENFYLCHYKPLLNTLFRSFYSADINKKMSLFDNIKALKTTENLATNIEEQTLMNDTSYMEEGALALDSTYGNKDINKKPAKFTYPVWVYKWTDDKLLDPYFIRYNDRQSVSEALGVAVKTINRYLDTKLPKKLFFKDEYYLFFTYEIKDLVSLSLDIQNTISLAKSSKLIFNSNIAKEVWVYTVDCDNNILLLNNEPFKSLGEAGAFLCTGSATIVYYLDNFKIYKDYYFFTNALDTEDMNILLERHSLNKSSTPKKSQVKVWVYDCETLTLLNNTSFPSIQAVMDYLKVGRRTALKYIDSDEILKSNGIMVYLYSQEISKSKADNLRQNLDINISQVKSENIWVYKKQGNHLGLFYDNPFSSINQINKVLNISNHTIKKYLNTNNSFKDFYFYSVKIEDRNLLDSDLFDSVESNRKTIWVYREMLHREDGKLTFELINSKPFDTITEAAKELKISDMTINKYLDSFSVYKGLYFFSKAESEESILSNVMETKQGIWVYMKLNDSLVLLDNQPFKSKWTASKSLKVSNKNIDKYLDTGESHKGYYFFSKTQRN